MRVWLFTVSSTLFAFLVGCGGASPSTTPLTDAMNGSVGVYVSSSFSFETNAFVIDAPEGAILVGTTLTPREALQAKAYAEQVTGKELALALVLHATHDQFNGTNTLRGAGVRVVTSEQIANQARTVFANESGWLEERFRPDWPERSPELGTATDPAIDIAGTTLQLHSLGDHLVVTWEGHAFVGNLVANGHHGAVDGVHVEAWRTRLDEIAALEPRRIHPGRGASGGPVLLSRQREYLDEIMRIARTSIPEVPIAEDALPKIVERAQARFPRLQSIDLLRQSLPALYRHIAGDREGSR